MDPGGLGLLVGLSREHHGDGGSTVVGVGEQAEPGRGRRGRVPRGRRWWEGGQWWRSRAPGPRQDASLSHGEFLELVLADEATRRDTSTAALRAKVAGLDPWWFPSRPRCSDSPVDCRRAGAGRTERRLTVDVNVSPRRFRP